MSDFLLLNEKRSINRSSIPGKPFWLPFYISEAPLASYFASITVSELLMFFTFKYLNFFKVSELHKVHYLVGFYLSELVACCANCCSKCYYCCECNSKY